MTSYFPFMSRSLTQAHPARLLPHSTNANCDASASGGSEASSRAFSGDTVVTTARAFAVRARYA